MKQILLGAALLFSMPAVAQQNRLSLGLSTFEANSLRLSVPDPKYDLTYSAFRLLPVLGYHRIVKGNTGVGLELGWSRYTTRSSDHQAIGGIRSDAEVQSSYNEMYICPGLFSMIATRDRQFRFIPALSIPVNIIPDFRGSSFEREVDAQTMSDARLQPLRERDGEMPFREPDDRWGDPVPGGRKSLRRITVQCRSSV